MDRHSGVSEFGNNIRACGTGRRAFYCWSSRCGATPAQKDDQARSAAAPPTFAKDIAPILYTNCAPCHRPGQAAPFALIQYTDVKHRADKIAKATTSGKMPPWLPEAGEFPFVGERRLRADQIALIRRWVEAGSPEGDRANLPRAPAWPEGWQLGQPDLIVTMPRPFVLAPGKADRYRHVVFPLSLTAGRFVRGVEFHPDTAGRGSEGERVKG